MTVHAAKGLEADYAVVLGLVSGRLGFPTEITDDPLLEPIAAMGVLAGVTKRIRIGTAVLVMPYRNPVLTAPNGRRIWR